ncbi:TPM domain-containing protein [candidate division KSB1 bacterium]
MKSLYQIFKFNPALLHLFFTVSLLFLFSGDIFSQDFPKRPKTLVNDYIGILSQSERNSLEQKLVSFNDSTSTQISIIIVDDLLGLDPADYAQRIGEKWGVGQKGFDNGVVILVKPTGGEGQRKTYIATGYGLEGVIPDLIAKRIVDNELNPQFRKGNFYDGLDKACNVIMSLALGEYSSEDYKNKTKGNPLGFLIPIVLFAIFVLISKMNASKSYSKVNNIPFWTAFWLMSATSKRSHGGSWGNFNSGSGGFGGFGGGSFGGGGAGGSW